MKIDDFFSKYPKAVVAFSGGVDSAVLLHMAKKYCHSVTAVFVKTEFQPSAELEDAAKFCENCGVNLNIVNVDVFENSKIIQNDGLRCYYCKQMIFKAVFKVAKAGETVLDGTNADDDINNRPGYRALQEMGVMSPLRLCGYTKEMIREYAKNNGISLWNKPSYSCLATRIPTHTQITYDNLRITNICEQAMFKLGFFDFRVRYAGESCFLEISEKEFDKLFQNRVKVVNSLKNCYDKIYLDLKGR